MCSAPDGFYEKKWAKDNLVRSLNSVYGTTITHTGHCPHCNDYKKVIRLHTEKFALYFCTSCKKETLGAELSLEQKIAIQQELKYLSEIFAPAQPVIEQSD